MGKGKEKVNYEESLSEDFCFCSFVSQNYWPLYSSSGGTFVYYCLRSQVEKVNKFIKSIRYIQMSKKFETL